MAGGEGCEVCTIQPTTKSIIYLGKCDSFSHSEAIEDVPGPEQESPLCNQKEEVQVGALIVREEIVSEHRFHAVCY